jgi:predicted SAM-dependent methyltransferase
MQSIKRVALSSPDISYPDGKSRYVVSQMFTQFGGHSGEVKLYEYTKEVRMLHVYIPVMLY